MKGDLARAGRELGEAQRKWDGLAEYRADQRPGVCGRMNHLSPGWYFRFFKGWNKQWRPPFHVFHSMGRSFTYLFSLTRRKDIWPWFDTHTLFFKKQFSLLLCFVYQGSGLSFFLFSLLPGWSQNIEYLERKKGKLANRLSISFVSFRDYYFP